MRLQLKTLLTRALAALGMLAVACAVSSAPAAAQDFATWLETLKHDAAAAGISQATIDTALSELTPIDQVIQLDRRQPEFTQTFWDYLSKRVTSERIARGRQLAHDHAGLLSRVQARYGVQARFLVAFWGLESNFGDHTGGFPVIAALATLAYEGRRGAFFRAQLMDALRIVDQGHIDPKIMQGSWAGAMGQVQFIPSTFVRHAVDFDGDGRRDLWGSLPDVFASAANYLQAIGWHGDETWGREVSLPPDFDVEQASLEVRKPIAAWQDLGVRRIDGSDLPHADMKGAIVLPAGHAGPAFLVYDNFNSILSWNRSILYAIAVGRLADRIAGLGGLQSPRPASETPLSRADVEEMQTLLASLGLDPGTADGMIGPQTRAALRTFQRREGLAPDGYPTTEILQRLRAGLQNGARKD